MAEYVMVDAKTKEFLCMGEQEFESEQQMNEFKFLQRKMGRLVHFAGEPAAEKEPA